MPINAEKAFADATRLVREGYGALADHPLVREFGWKRFERWVNDPPEGSTQATAKCAARYFILTEIRNVAAVQGTTEDVMAKADYKPEEPFPYAGLWQD